MGIRFSSSCVFIFYIFIFILFVADVCNKWKLFDRKKCSYTGKIPIMLQLPLVLQEFLKNIP